MEHCEAEFKLAARQKDGSTLRQNLEAVERMTGRRPPELNTGEIPDCLQHVWNWFLQLNSQRTSNGFGVNPITNQDMWFFFQLEKIEPESWELDLIRRFDNVAMRLHNEKQKEPKAKTK